MKKHFVAWIVAGIIVGGLLSYVAAQQATQRLSVLRGQLNGWYEGLKKLADVKDNRSQHY